MIFNINNLIKYLLCILLGVILAVVAMTHFAPVRRGDDTSVPTENTTPLVNPSNTIKSETAVVSVAPKSNPKTDPDLIVKDVYIAEINGRRVEAPVVAVEGAQKPGDMQATVKHTIDVTPLVKQMTPKWEVGAGVDVDNNFKVNPCVSLQRNYKTDKALEVVVTVDKSNGQIKNGMLLHKWRF